MFAHSDFWLPFALFWPFYWLLRRCVTLRNIVLLLASAAFVVWFSKAYVAILGLSIVVTYLLALQLSRTSSRCLLWTGILFHFGMLALVKYHSDLPVDLLSALGPNSNALNDIFVPLGLSFTSFTAVGYLIDVYRGDSPVKNILTFSLFYAFFPKLVSGPIERVSKLVPQLEKPATIDLEAIRKGVFLIVWGLVQKFCIADYVGFYADRAFSGVLLLTTMTSFLATFAFTIQIYADFSGYSDIAKGIAHLLGFDLSWNFKLPWFALSPQDFWRRWHVSLSEWFRDYVYIPLGGSRKGLARTCLNLCITMALVGIWHSAVSLPFLVWGVLQGVLLALQRFAQETRGRLHSTAELLSEPIVSRLLFLPAMFFGWALFRSPTIGMFWTMWFSGGSTNLLGAYVLRVSSLLMLFLLPLLLMDLYRAYKKDLYAFAHANAAVQLGFYLVAFYALFLLPRVTSSPFVYAGF